MDTGHWPMFSQPNELAGLLVDTAENAEAVRILEDIKQGREQVFSHDEVWGAQG
ncbi:hypothetical protein NE857_25015 [Nocardiopsis exhalans]|uniref:Uncharacterized protein n=1 Tax=Nocardiopsis exhalans TaxID=163604 RepID=A0ABY5D5S6_9ACTN|nr:hypothetical protein [Nocardiopsis exhalans]USY18537.1 hypothetical protein NE857_25015 [Nocardiopsis exhalans]